MKIINEAQYIQHLPKKALDALYESLSVQTMPEGRYDGFAWIHGHPVLGWLASLVWAGKVFNEPRRERYVMASTREQAVRVFTAARDRANGERMFQYVRNRVLGLMMFRGLASVVASDLNIDYPRLGLTDTVRQVSPTLYLGRMQWRRWTVHFTLNKPKHEEVA